MAGNPAALGAVHQHYGDSLGYSMTVGKSHHDAEFVAVELPGPAPQMFFAPAEVTRRLEEWGREGYAEKMATAIARFVEASHGWLTVEQRTGGGGAEAAWADTYAGSVSPDAGLIVAVGD